MIFSSPLFLFVFLPLTLVAWFASGRQKIILLIASFLFYGWGEPILVLLLAFVIIFNYTLGELFGTIRERRLLFIVGVVIDLGLLIVFKYSEFIVSNVNTILALLHVDPLPVPSIPLPLGISFFTFQAIAYLADVHAKNILPAGSLFRFALFKSFFPQLIAGPIVRYQYVSRDLSGDYASVELFALGARRFIFGLAKKVIIADQLAAPVDSIFGGPINNLSMTTAWLGAIGFALQIYFDFSGYSDMAIGMGYLFGVRLPENFNYPYVAQSMQDFWRRWHITLSTWFRDYVYFPLGGNRKGVLRTYCNLIIVFALCGFWHGASWNFLVWGLWNGIFLVLERGPIGVLIRRLPAAMQHSYLIMAMLIGWVFFRASDLGHAFSMLEIMFGSQGITNSAYPAGAYISYFVFCIGGLGVVCSLPWRVAVAEPIRRILANPLGRFSEPIVLAWMALVCGAFVASQTHLAFIYFRF